MPIKVPNLERTEPPKGHRQHIIPLVVRFFRNLALLGMTQRLEDTGSLEPRTGFKSGRVKLLTLYKQ